MTNRKPEIDEGRARELLKRERQRVEAGLAEFERLKRSSLEESETETEPGADAALVEERQLDDAVEAQLREELEAIERAEKRVEEGSYGFSVESGEPIPAGRLEAIPWAERTAEEQERREG